MDRKWPGAPGRHHLRRQTLAGYVRGRGPGTASDVVDVTRLRPDRYAQGRSDLGQHGDWPVFALRSERRRACDTVRRGGQSRDR